MDASPACPFVAFADDRDARADRPDHRHRCYAEDPPAPRAAAHQEAYCLSSAFPVCPTFQAWARREAARTHVASPAAEPDGPERSEGADGPVGGSAEEWSPATRPPDQPIESTPRRNPPRDWAAPPPWATGQIPPSGSTAPVPYGTGSPAAPDFLTPRPSEGAGLTGSTADRIASGEPVADVSRGTGSGAGGASAGSSAAGSSRSRDLPSSGPDPDLAGLVAGGAAMTGSAGAGAGRGTPGDARTADPLEPEAAAAYPPSRAGRRPTVSSTRSGQGHGAPKPPRREHVQQHDGPSWERARRYEAYPTIRTRAGLGGLPPLPRVAVLALALAVAALGLFFLPALLGIGGKDVSSPSPSPSAVAATPTPSPTEVPEPTPQVYVIKQGDTLSKIAKQYGLTLDQLLAANKDTIKNPDKISVGDEIIIPVPPPDEVSGASSESTAP